MRSKKKKKKLRYGENPNQKAYLTYNNKKSIFDYQISGKQISYNNIIDLDSGLRCLEEFSEPTSIIVKHTNPCGVASSNDIYDAFKKSFESDKKSAFGGIIFLNRKVNLKISKLINRYFFEMVVAKSFETNAINLLKTKKNLILIQIPSIKKQNLDYKSTLFGDIYQSRDITKINKSFIKNVSNKKYLSKSIEDLLFSLKVAKHLKSNAVVLSKNKQTLGLGHGHTNRVDALYSAINNKKINFKNKSFVCASDGFFPFTDSLQLLYENGCKTVAQPSGSIKDKSIIAYAKKNKITLFFTKNRLFKH